MNWNELKPQIIDLIYTYGFQPDGGSSYILKNPCKRRPSPIVVIDDSNTKSQFAVVRMNTITYTLYPNGKESFTSSESNRSTLILCASLSFFSSLPPIDILM